jgi:hypothetical protein
VIAGRAARFVPLFLALTACAAAAPAARTKTQQLPLTVRSPTLTISVSARSMTEHSINVVAQLITRVRLPAVQLRVHSRDRRLAATQGCTFRPLEPPRVEPARRPYHPNPLPLVPSCSLVLHAARAGRYPLELRIVDGAGHDLVSPIHTTIPIPWNPAQRH